MMITTSIFEQMFFCFEGAMGGAIITEKRENRCQKENLFAHNVLMSVLGFNNNMHLNGT